VQVAKEKAEKAEEEADAPDPSVCSICSAVRLPANSCAAVVAALVTATTISKLAAPSVAWFAGWQERVSREEGQGLCGPLVAGAAKGSQARERVLLPAKALDPHLVWPYKGE
jgi:hypothetical protein